MDRDKVKKALEKLWECGFDHCDNGEEESSQARSVGEALAAIEPEAREAYRPDKNWDENCVNKIPHTRYEQPDGSRTVGPVSPPSDWAADAPGVEGLDDTVFAQAAGKSDSPIRECREPKPTNPLAELDEQAESWGFAPSVCAWEKERARLLLKALAGMIKMAATYGNDCSLHYLDGMIKEAIRGR